MPRRFPLLVAFAVLSAGCVPVTEPVGDIDKAEQDKALVGAWAEAEKPDTVVLKIDAPPAVKGNPKGLMRMTFVEGMKEDPVWFFPTPVGKEKYGNLCLDADAADAAAAKLGTEGEYAKWSKGTGRRYFVFHYAAGKDGVAVNFGDETAVRKLMADEKVEKDKMECFKTPAGWLAKYLEQNGRDTLFPAAKDAKLVKAKS